MSVTRDQRHLKQHRCPVCDGAEQDPRGQGKRCTGFTSADGEWCHCSRDEHSGRLDQSAAGLYVHKLHGPCNCGVEHGADNRPRANGRREPSAIYNYVDEEGALLWRKLRFASGEPKFLIDHPDGDGGFVAGRGGARLVPYRLHELAEDDGDRHVHLVEGEKDVDRLRKLGLLATCNPDGAGPGKWKAVADTICKVVAGRVVVIIADADEKGRPHAREAEALLLGVAQSVTVLEPTKGKDISEHLDAGGTLEDLVQLRVEATSGAAKANGAKGAKANGKPPIGTVPQDHDDPFDGAPSEHEPPIIRHTTDQNEMVDEAVAALRADPDLYVRAGALTRVVPSDGTEAPSLVERDVGAPIIRRATPEHVIERLSIYAQFVATKSSGRGKNRVTEQVATRPPPWVANHVLKRERWPGYRRLVAPVTGPTMRPNGSVLQKPGYDRASGLLYIDTGACFPLVEDEPSEQAIQDAKALLLDVIGDFEIDQLGRSWWVALLFTLLARSMVNGRTPLFVTDATVPGAGKGLLVRTVHRIAYGSDPAHMSMPPTDEEMRKQITTSLLAGDPVILIDNISAPLGGDSLDAVLTAPVWKVRLLGKNEDSGSLIPIAVWVATGNGVEIVGDLARRSVRVRLVPRCEQPEERSEKTYKHPERRGVDALLNWIDSQRPKLLHAALTCLRGWVVARAKSPKDMPTPAYFGGFENWSNTVAAAVLWLGLPDVNEARVSKDAAMDPKRAALRTLFEAIRDYQRDEGVSARELFDRAFPNEERQTKLPGGGAPERVEPDEKLAAALGTLVPDRPRLQQRVQLLGNKLRTLKLRIFDLKTKNQDGVEVVQSLQLQTGGTGHGGAQRWLVLPPEASS